MTRLLDKDPTKRLRANRVGEVKSHGFFDGMDWHELGKKNTTAFIPKDVSRIFNTRPSRQEQQKKRGCDVWTGEGSYSQGVLYEK